MENVTREQANNGLNEGLYMLPDGFIFYVDRVGREYNVMGRQIVHYVNYRDDIKNEIAKAIQKDQDFVQEYKKRTGNNQLAG